VQANFIYRLEGTLAGLVTDDAPSPAPLAGVRCATSAGNCGLTDATGHYQFAVPAGSGRSCRSGSSSATRVVDRLGPYDIAVKRDRDRPDDRLPPQRQRLRRRPGRPRQRPPRRDDRVRLPRPGRQRAAPHLQPRLRTAPARTPSACPTDRAASWRSRSPATASMAPTRRRSTSRRPAASTSPTTSGAASRHAPRPSGQSGRRRLDQRVRVRVLVGNERRQRHLHLREPAPCELLGDARREDRLRHAGPRAPSRSRREHPWSPDFQYVKLAHLTGHVHGRCRHSTRKRLPLSQRRLLLSTDASWQLRGLHPGRHVHAHPADLYRRLRRLCHAGAGPRSPWQMATSIRSPAPSSTRAWRRCTCRSSASRVQHRRRCASCPSTRTIGSTLLTQASNRLRPGVDKDGHRGALRPGGVAVTLRVTVRVTATTRLRRQTTRRRSRASGRHTLAATRRVRRSSGGDDPRPRRRRRGRRRRRHGDHLARRLRHRRTPA